MLLLFAIISIILALIFYAVSIFREIVKNKFTRATLVLFWIGFAFDLTGTVCMFMITEGLSMDLHAIIGIIALFLMGIKAIWALIRYKKGNSSGAPKIYTAISSVVWLSAFLMGFMR